MDIIIASTITILTTAGFVMYAYMVAGFRRLDNDLIRLYASLDNAAYRIMNLSSCLVWGLIALTAYYFGFEVTGITMAVFLVLGLLALIPAFNIVSLSSRAVARHS